MQDTILQTDTPIGQVWKMAKLETFREIVDFRREHDPVVAGLFGLDAELLSRTYLIHAGGLPMALIVEKFPATYFGSSRDRKLSAIGKGCVRITTTSLAERLA